MRAFASKNLHVAKRMALTSNLGGVRRLNVHEYVSFSKSFGYSSL